MRLQDFTSSQPAIGSAIWLSRHLPRRIGLTLASLVATLMTWLKPELYWTVHHNLRCVMGPHLGQRDLQRLVWCVFRCAAQSYYDFFHNVSRPLEALTRVMRIPDEFFDLLAAARQRRRGLVVLATHHANFDLAGLVIAARGIPVQVLSLADPGPGFRILNQLRTTGSMYVTPISAESLRTAVRNLASGGTVITGIDRPVPGDRQLVEFFGRPAYLPAGPIRLALMADVPVLLASCYAGEDGIYHLKVSGPLDLVRTGNRQEDVLMNFRRVIQVLEEHVRAFPEQWLMFHRVWPDFPTGSAGGRTEHNAVSTL
jgi:lauroyl/myristoyl acyltransferase